MMKNYDIFLIFLPKTGVGRSGKRRLGDGHGLEHAVAEPHVSSEGMVSHKGQAHHHTSQGQRFSRSEPDSRWIGGN